MTFTHRQIRSERIEKKRGQKNIGLLLVCIAFIVFLFFGLNISSVGNIVTPAGNYTLDRGVTLSNLPESLELSVADWRYKLWLKYLAPEIKNLQAGGYKLESDMTLREVFATTLQKPVYTDLTITILPGWNSYDIDDYLYRKDIIEDPGDFLLTLRDNFSKYQAEYPFLEGVPSLEGFLYPDTYRVSQYADADEVIRKMLDTFGDRIGSSYRELGELGYRELILASIVEREERISSEKPIVADILSKRVNEGIPMGADATVCYGYAKTQKQCTPSFIGEVIAIKHPYNTRNKQGYPPTPISNLSLDTWEAVLEKEPSPYYYYLHDSVGNIHYGKTLEEHNRNKRTYLQ